MTEYVWKPLAEIELNFFKLKHLAIYCLCSRAFVRSNIRVCKWEKLFNEKWDRFKMKDETETTACVGYELSEHSMESQCFKEQEAEAVSCYCSASHYSTDDYESVVQSTSADQFNLCKDQFLVYSLQNSDSGADLSEHFTDKACKNPEFGKKSSTYLKSELEFAWEKYWSENGESIIWKSWIEKYGAYINPSYLEQNSLCENLNGNLNDVMKEENVSESCSKEGSNRGSVIHSSIVVTDFDHSNAVKDENFVENKEKIPDLKISSYSSSSNVSETDDAMKGNIYIDEFDLDCKILKSSSFGSYTSYEKIKCTGNDDDKFRSSDNERVRSRCSITNLSVQSIANTTVTTDSMTNVTKITLSSLDLSCESDSVKSNTLSTPSEDSSGFPVFADISNSCMMMSIQEETPLCVAETEEILVLLPFTEPETTVLKNTDYKGNWEFFGPFSTSSSSSKEEICTEADIWWQRVWKEHYEDQYSSCYQTFLDNYDKRTKAEVLEAKVNDVDETVEEVDKINTDNEKSKKDSTFTSQQFTNSVGYILQRPDKANLDSEQSARNECRCTRDNNQMPEIIKDTLMSSGGCNSLKRHLEISDDTFDESEEVESKSRKKFTKKISQKMKTLKKKEKISKKSDVKQALALMGFCFKVDSDEIQSGYVRYRKKNIRGLNTRLKLFDNRPRMHLFFDDDGNPFESDQNESIDIVQAVEENCDELEDDFSKSEENIVESLRCEANSSSIENGVNAVDENRKQKRKKKKKRRKQDSLPKEIVDNKNLLKYWHRRYKLFSKFDEGIKLDAESWFSVTPEKLAQYHAERCRCDVIVDAFCGAGGNSIQFAFTCERVIAIDIDPYKIEIAKNNARIYGVEERIEFIIGDFTKIASKLQADVIFLSPPWGGPGYMKDDVYTLDNILPPLGGEGLFQMASAVAENVAYFLPKNACANDLVLLSGPGGEIEIEQNFMDLRLHSITAYFGSLIMDPDDPYITSV